MKEKFLNIYFKLKLRTRKTGSWDWRCGWEFSSRGGRGGGGGGGEGGDNNRGDLPGVGWWCDMEDNP